VKKPGHRSGTKKRIGEKHKAGEKYGVERRKNRRGGYEKWIDYEGKQQKNYEK
jgi:hypothetical protein